MRLTRVSKTGRQTTTLATEGTTSSGMSQVNLRFEAKDGTKTLATMTWEEVGRLACSVPIGKLVDAGLTPEECKEFLRLNMKVFGIEKFGK